MHSKYTICLLALVFSLLTVSCLTDSEQPASPSQFAVDFQLENVGDRLIAGEDTMQVMGVSFLQGRIALQSTEEDSVVLFSGIGVYNYQFPGSEIQRLLVGNLEPGTYHSMLYNIEKAGADNQDIPDSFIDGEAEDQRYSMIITGIFNNSEFTYKSTQPFDLEFDLGSPVEVPENNTAVSLGVNFDVRQVFVSADSSSFLDPSDSTNAEQINSNIEVAIGLLPFE